MHRILMNAQNNIELWKTEESMEAENLVIQTLSSKKGTYTLLCIYTKLNYF